MNVCCLLFFLEIVYNQGSQSSVSLHPAWTGSKKRHITFFKRGSEDAFKLKPAGPGMHWILADIHSAADIHSTSCLFGGHLLFCLTSDNVLSFTETTIFYKKQWKSCCHLYSKRMIVFGPIKTLTWGSKDPFTNAVWGSWNPLKEKVVGSPDTCTVHNKFISIHNWNSFLHTCIHLLICFDGNELALLKSITATREKCSWLKTVVYVTLR